MCSSSEFTPILRENLVLVLFSEEITGCIFIKFNFLGDGLYFFLSEIGFTDKYPKSGCSMSSIDNYLFSLDFWVYSIYVITEMVAGNFISKLGVRGATALPARKI